MENGSSNTATMYLPTFADVQVAARRIQPYAHRTPVLTSRNLNELTGARLFFKCENFQRVGAFKFRGACNAVFSLDERELQRGVATHSSGNHAAALALAARLRGARAFIVMPETAPEVKKKAVQAYGGEITFCQPTLEAREQTLAAVVAKTGATVVHPYNDARIIAGQGTAALELLEAQPGLEVIVTPVGGGGLLSGTALTADGLSPSTRVIAAEPAGADDAARSFRDGCLHPSMNPQTIADGLLTSLGELTFAVIQRHVDDILTVSEEAIVEAMRLLWERMKIVVEPSGAVPLALVLERRRDFAGKSAGLILSGGNVDLRKLPFSRSP